MVEILFLCDLSLFLAKLFEILDGLLLFVEDGNGMRFGIFGCRYERLETKLDPLFIRLFKGETLVESHDVASLGEGSRGS